jgi:hypothetical protein
VPSPDLLNPSSLPHFLPLSNWGVCWYSLLPILPPRHSQLLSSRVALVLERRRSSAIPWPLILLFSWLFSTLTHWRSWLCGRQLPTLWLPWRCHFPTSNLAGHAQLPTFAFFCLEALPNNARERVEGSGWADLNRRTPLLKNLGVT